MIKEKETDYFELPYLPWECRLELEGGEWYKVTLEIRASASMQLDIFDYLAQQASEQGTEIIVQSVGLERL